MAKRSDEDIGIATLRHTYLITPNAQVTDDGRADKSISTDDRKVHFL